MGPCVGDDDGSPAQRFEPPCFDRLECTVLGKIGFWYDEEDGPITALRILTWNEDEDGAVFTHGRGGADDDDDWPGIDLLPSGWGGQLRDLELTAMTRGSSIYGLRRRAFDWRPDAILGRWPDDADEVELCSMQDVVQGTYGPRATTIVRSFYGRVNNQRITGLGVIYGPAEVPVWSPRATERYSDAAVARTEAVLAGPGRLKLLPEAILLDVLAFALALFPKWNEWMDRRLVPIVADPEWVNGKVARNGVWCEPTPEELDDGPVFQGRPPRNWRWDAGQAAALDEALAEEAERQELARLRDELAAREAARAALSAEATRRRAYADELRRRAAEEEESWRREQLRRDELDPEVNAEVTRIFALWEEDEENNVWRRRIWARWGKLAAHLRGKHLRARLAALQEP